MSNFKLEFPLGLLIGFLGLLLIAILMIVVFHRRYRTALLFSNFTPLLKAQERVGRKISWKKLIPVLLDLLLVLLMGIIISRPHAVTRVIAKGYAVVLVIDISGSMMAKDFKPSRIEAAKQAAKLLVRGLKGHPKIGVVVFNNTSRVILVPTSDKVLVLRAIDSIKANYGGTAIGDGISSAVALLTAVEEPSKFIILLSDGENNMGMNPIQAAEIAKQYKIVIYTVGIGTRQGSYIPNVPYPVRLDEGTLKRIASITGGEYFYAQDKQKLMKIFSQIRDKVGFKKGYHDVSYVFATIGLLIIGFKWLLLALFRYAEF